MYFCNIFQPISWSSSIDSNPIEGEALARWKNVNLNPASRNFIARVIGDQHVYYDFDKDSYSEILHMNNLKKFKLLSNI